MASEINGRTIKVSVSYGLKVPINPADTFQGSHDAHVSYSVEEEVPAGATPEQIVKQATDLEKHLEGGVKLAVFSALDVGFDEDMNPVVTLPATPSGMPIAAAAAPYPQAAPAPAPQATPNYGGQGATYSPPKASQEAREALPRVLMDFFDQGTPNVAFIDQRPLKANGTYKPTAPDFKSVEKFDWKGEMQQVPLWCEYQGKPVERTQALMSNMIVMPSAPNQGPDTSPF